MKSPSPVGRGLLVFAILSGAGFMVSLDATAVVAAFPALRSYFGTISPGALSWVVNAYTLLFAALLIPAGRWADRSGRRRAFLTGLALFTVSSLACAVAPGVVALILARALQAVGAAMLTPAALALVIEVTPVEKRAATIGLWGAVLALAAAVGPGLGSWLIDAFSWRAIFWINVPIGLAVGWAAWRFTPTSHAAAGAASPDWIGSGLIAGGIGLIVAGGVELEQPGGASRGVFALIVLGLALLVACVAWSWRRPAGTLDLTLFRNRNYTWGNAATLVFGTAFGLMFLTFFLFMTGVWRYSQTRAGLAAMVGPLMVIPFAVLSGRIATRHGHRGLLVTGGLLYAAAQVWYAWRLAPNPAYAAVWLPGQLVTGAAIGLVLPSLAAAAVSGLPPTALAVGNAMNTAVRQLGSVIGVAIGVGLIGRSGVTLESFRTVYVVLAAGGLLTALLVLKIDTRPKAPAHPVRLRAQARPLPVAGRVDAGTTNSSAAGSTESLMVAGECSGRS